MVGVRERYLLGVLHSIINGTVKFVQSRDSISNVNTAINRTSVLPLREST